MSLQKSGELEFEDEGILFIAAIYVYIYIIIYN